MIESRRASSTVPARLFAALVILLSANAARAQFNRMPPAGDAQISSSGHVRLQRPPTHLRMYLQITGKGKTLEEALAALKERREAIAVQLDKLGADKASVVFTAPSVDAAAANQQQRMEAMIAARMGGVRTKKPGKAVKPPISLSSTLTVQWPLAGDTLEKLLVAADNVREKVKSSDLAGSKEAAKLSPEEQEAAEEMAAEMARNSGMDEEAVKPGQPRFMFVARLTAEDRQSAQAAAFAKAKTHAAELARAAGVGLGPLTGLSGEAGMAVAGDSPYQNYNPYMRNEYQFLQSAVQNAAADDRTTEAIALNPDGTGFDVMINATFAIDASKPQK
jgi:uncharacterized protein YggE